MRTPLPGDGKLSLSDGDPLISRGDELNISKN
jgi:hypothetical protein